MAKKRKPVSTNSTALKSALEPSPKSILVIDIGGTKIKILTSGESEPRKMNSGKKLTPIRMIEGVLKLAAGWKYEAISIGFPGLVGNHGPRSEPGNLGPGWVGFDFPAAFGQPVRITNDAAMQALGSYEGGRMLFIGLGTGVGSALIADFVVIPLELGQLPYKRRITIGDVLGRRGYKKLGKLAWRKIVGEVTEMLIGAFSVDYLVLGGGNSKAVRELPPGVRRGNNLTAFRGGMRLWNFDDVPTLSASGEAPAIAMPRGEWRVI
jgi:polyphosphate glucokinase